MSRPIGLMGGSMSIVKTISKRFAPFGAGEECTRKRFGTPHRPELGEVRCHRVLIGMSPAKGSGTRSGAFHLGLIVIAGRLVPSGSERGVL